MPETRFPEGGKPDELVRVHPHGALMPLLMPGDTNPELTRHLETQIRRRIFDTRPTHYGKAIEFLLVSKTPTLFAGAEASWSEMPDQRIPIVVDDGASAAGAVLTAAQAPNPGGFRTATIPTTTDILQSVGLNVQLHFRAGGWGFVIAKDDNLNTITIRSGASEGLPAIVQGDVITIGAEHRADGERRIVNNSRFDTLNRTNFIPVFSKAMEFGRRAWLERKNGSATNKPEMEEQRLITALLDEATTEMWNGSKAIKRNDIGKDLPGMDGIKTQMLNGGVTPTVTNIAGFQAAFEAKSTSTLFKSGTTMLVGTNRLLLEVSKQYKELQTRYTPNDTVANMDLSAIKMGGRTHVLFPTDIFADPAHFPGFGDHLFMIDLDAIEMGGQTGMPFMDIGRTLSNRLLSYTDPRGSRDDIFSYPVEMCFTPMLVNPLQTALIRVEGFQ